MEMKLSLVPKKPVSTVMKLRLFGSVVMVSLANIADLVATGRIDGATDQLLYIVDPEHEFAFPVVISWWLQRRLPGPWRR
jgi:hypothetical protein